MWIIILMFTSHRRGNEAQRDDIIQLKSHRYKVGVILRTYTFNNCIIMLHVWLCVKHVMGSEYTFSEMPLIVNWKHQMSPVHSQSPLHCQRKQWNHIPRLLCQTDFGLDYPKGGSCMRCGGLKKEASFSFHSNAQREDTGRCKVLKETQMFLCRALDSSSDPQW